ncbi:MAG: hypothetical protein M0R05_00980 [Bacilli bacterium]|nr:hypothetical protein [Bacilli bacterium]MDD4076407.1 hypothetical protein [Bacilli bacterium]MDD4388451.1 hypothetical protein [Bacilli bacterium]
MQIRNNEKLLEYLIKKEKSYEVYSERLNELNTIFDPIKADLEKRKKDQIYFLGCVISVIVLFTFVIVLIPDVFSGKIIYTSYGLFASAFGYALFITAKTLKRIKKNNQKWLSEYQNIHKCRVEGNEYLNLASEEVFKVICENNNFDLIENKKKELLPMEFDKYWQELLKQEKKQIYKKIGESVTAEEIIEYYKKWGKEFTHAETEDHNAFLETRRKRHLG